MHEPPRIHVTFYTRPGCHLCEDVADHLEVLGTQWPLRIGAVDITRDIELHHRYWDKIPVVQIGSAELRAPITLAALTAAVVRERRTPATEG